MEAVDGMNEVAARSMARGMSKVVREPIEKRQSRISGFLRLRERNGNRSRETDPESAWYHRHRIHSILGELLVDWLVWRGFNLD
jgi:hypothetical protein